RPTRSMRSTTRTVPTSRRWARTRETRDLPASGKTTTSRTDRLSARRS
ncbi:hypothetical protein RF55_26161, partial [Lasius niger]